MTRLRAREWSDEIQPFSPLPLHHQMNEILVSHVVSRRADRHQANAFGLAVRAPLLEVHYQLENADSTPIAYVITTWQADKIGLQL
ncbi:MAG TPA: hypothetical protein VF086_19865, partial [Propionibacteriaceae bacterium]